MIELETQIELTKEVLDQMLQGGNFKTGKKIPDGRLVLLLVADNNFVYGYETKLKTTFKKPIYTSVDGKKVFNFSMFSYQIDDFTEDLSDDWGLGR